MDDLIEIAFLGAMNANDRELALPLSAHAERNLLKRRLNAAIAAIEAAGYAVVPVKPTEAMKEAGMIGLSANGVDEASNGDASMCYTAMIEAA